MSVSSLHPCRSLLGALRAVRLCLRRDDEDGRERGRREEASSARSVGNAKFDAAQLRSSFETCRKLLSDSLARRAERAAADKDDEPDDEEEEEVDEAEQEETLVQSIVEALGKRRSAPLPRLERMQ